MADLNAGLLAGGNLGTLVQNANTQQAQQQQQLMQGFQSLATNLSQGLQKEQVNGVLQKNFNPDTNTLDQQGVIKDLFALNPQKALEYQQTIAQQQQDKLKAQAEAENKNSQSALYRAQAGEKVADTQSKQLTQLSTMIGAANTQQDMDRAINFAKSKGFEGVELFEGQQFTPELKARALNLVLDAKTRAELPIQQQNADSTRMTAQASQQNANTNQAELPIKQQNADTQRINANANFVITPYQQQQLQNERDKTTAQGGQVVDTSSGLQVVNTRTGTSTPVTPNTNYPGAPANAQAPISKEQEKAMTEAKTKISAGQSALQGVNDSIGFIDKILNNKGLDGIVGSINSYKPVALMNDAELTANGDLESVKSKVVLNVLQDLKNASATGATGFGALSEKEMKIIQDGLANLSRAQTTVQVQDNLNIIKNQFMKIKERAQKELDEANKKLTNSQPKTQDNSQGSDLNSLLKKHGLSQEKYNFLMQQQQGQ